MKLRIRNMVVSSLFLASGLVGSVANAAGTSDDDSAASGNGLYIGVAYGQTTIDLGDTSSIGLPIKFTTDESDMGGSIVLGYRINPYFALEAGYSDFGKATMKSSGTFTQGSVVFTNAEGSISTSGATLSAVLMLPVNNWDFGVRLGGYFANSTMDVKVAGRTTTTPTQNLSSSVSESASTTETLASLFIGATFAEHYRLSLEWTRVPEVGDPEVTGEGDATLLALGLQYRF